MGDHKARLYAERFLQVVHDALGLPMIVTFVAAIVGGVGVWRAWNLAGALIQQAAAATPHIYITGSSAFRSPAISSAVS